MKSAHHLLSAPTWKGEVEGLRRVVAGGRLTPWTPFGRTPDYFYSRDLVDKKDEALVVMRARRGGTQCLWVIYGVSEDVYLTGGIEGDRDSAKAAADTALASLDPEVPLPEDPDTRFLLGFVGDLLNEEETEGGMVVPT